MRDLLTSYALNAARRRLSDARTAGAWQPSTFAMPAALRGRIKMATVVVTLKIMPRATDVDLDAIKDRAVRLISEFGGEVGKTIQEPIAFGLVALILMFIMDESIGSTEELEKSIAELDTVSSCEVTDVRRTIG